MAETRKSETIFGRNAVLEALREGIDLSKVYIQRNLRGPLEKDVRRLCTDNDVPLQYVDAALLNRMTNRQNHQGLVAHTSPIPYYNLADVLPQIFENGQVPLLVMLDGVTDVRNFGAIARSAEVLGAHALIIPFKHSAQITDTAIKASAGALWRIPVCRAPKLSQACTYAKDSGIRIYAAEGKAEKNLSEMALNEPTMVLLGSEGQGIRSSLLALADDAFHIPQIGQTDSLNVSVASGIILYEAWRQRL